MFDSLNLVMLLSMEHRGGRIVRRCRLLYDVYLDEGDRIMYNPFSRGTGRGTASIGGRSLWRYNKNNLTLLKCKVSEFPKVSMKLSEFKLR